MKSLGSDSGSSQRDTKEWGDGDLDEFTLTFQPLSVTRVLLMFRHPALKYGGHENKMCIVYHMSINCVLNNVSVVVLPDLTS